MRGQSRLVLIAVAIASTGCGHAERQQPLIPSPVGRGPGFLPPPVGPLPRQEGVGCTPGRLRGRYRMHLEIFARRRVVIVPAGVGVRLPAVHSSGRIVSGSCRAALRTLDPTGVVHFDRTDLRLGDLFRIWRMPLERTRLLSFSAGRASAVSGFIDGARFTGDLRSIPLRDGAEVVLEVNGYVPPHRSYLFPRQVRGATAAVP